MKLRKCSVRLTLLVAMAAMAAASAAASRVDVAAHGKRFRLGWGPSAVTVLYLRGTPYEMGYAHGALCRTEVRYWTRDVMPRMLKLLHCSDARADAIWRGYTNHLRPEFLEELRGLAAGSGVSLRDITRAHAVPDISEWHCTFFAANHFATRDGKLLQIRALDYETGAGIQRYPALIVYKPEHGVPFVNVGWLGHCGLVTGMNADGVAMSEIGDDWDKKTDSFNGRPLTYVMRETVQFGRNLDEALHLVKQLPRTTSLLYCLSSAQDDDFRVLATSHTQCRIFQAWNLPFQTQTGLGYASMGMDSDWNRKVGDWLLANFGTLDPAAARRMMRQLKTGSLHAVVFHPSTLDLWVANAGAKTMAYDGRYQHFNLKDALADPFFTRE